ncbi:MAG: hypothetical protein ABII68_06660 [Pseudomonadota bacterium]
MNNALRLLSGAVLFLLFSVTACTPTKLVDARKDPSYTGGPMKSVMVLGITESPNSRKMFEEAFSKEFRVEGVEAIGSLDAIPRDVKLDKDNLDSHKDIIKAAASKLGIQTVFITHLVGVEEKEQYHPPMYDPFVTGPGGFNRPGYYAYHATYTPEYTTQQQYVALESNLYEVETEKLIWTASSGTVDPKSVSELINTLCKAVMKDLRKNGLIR